MYVYVCMCVCIHVQVVLCQFVSSCACAGQAEVMTELEKRSAEVAMEKMEKDNLKRKIMEMEENLVGWGDFGAVGAERGMGVEEGTGGMGRGLGMEEGRGLVRGVKE